MPFFSFSLPVLASSSIIICGRLDFCNEPTSLPDPVTIFRGTILSLRPLKSVILFGVIHCSGQEKGFPQLLLLCPDSWFVFGVLHSTHLRNLWKALVLLEGFGNKGKQIAMADWMRKSVRDEDFEEEDVWGVVKEREDSSPNMRKSKDYYSGSSSAWRLSTAPRKIPRGNSTATTHEAKVVQQSSAPVNIPDWSKIYGKSSKKVSRDGSWVDDGVAAYDHDHGDYHDDDDINDDGDMVPPHEWIARKLARSQISSFSVCEGIGRTLKGRDLSKVRNAILTKTGFLE